MAWPSSTNFSSFFPILFFSSSFSPIHSLFHFLPLPLSTLRSLLVSKKMRVASLSLLVALVPSALSASLNTSSHFRGPPALNAPSQGRPAEHKVTGKHGAVASEVDVCSNVGADLLEKGGSAADAIIGASLCVGSIDAFHSGIGGGGFILVRSVDGKYEEIDMRETMPALGNETMYSNNSDPTASTIGGLAVGVPGEIRGWEKLHQKYGKLPWKALFQPAISINRHGFKIPSQLGVAIAQYKDGFICKDKYWSESYCHSNGTAKKEGEVVKRLRYAATLETIANEGADAFYNGKIAKNIVSAAKARNGIISLKDLKDYKVVTRKSHNVTYGDARIFSTRAPSSGTVVLSALKTMAQYDLSENGPNGVGVNLTTHRIIEATKWGYAERAAYADPAFVKNVTELEIENLSNKAAKEKQSLITDNSTHPLEYYNPKRYEVLTDSGTSALASLDKSGLAVSLTTTVNLFWGSQVMTSDGIILNDEMDDFSSPNESNAFGYVPTSVNFIVPGKRPLSSISPLIAENTTTGEVLFVIGSAGGSKIITANIQNAFGLLSKNSANVQEQLAKPRWHDQLEPLTTSFEWAASNPKIPGWKGFDNSTVSFLASLGHNISFAAPGGSTAQGIQRFNNGTLLAGAEVRQLAARGAAI